MGEEHGYIGIEKGVKKLACLCCVLIDLDALDMDFEQMECTMFMPRVHFAGCFFICCSFQSLQSML